jgi:hypothetical protein
MIEIAQELNRKFNVLLAFAGALYPFGQLDPSRAKRNPGCFFVVG